MPARYTLEEIARSNARIAPGYVKLAEQAAAGQGACISMQDAIAQYSEIKPRDAAGQPPASKGPSEIEQLAFALIAQAGVDISVVERQAHLVPGRDFACDFVYRPGRIVIEIEGLTKEARTAGHQTIEGYGRNAEKYNLLAIHGWLVLRFTGRQIRKQAEMVITHIRMAVQKQLLLDKSNNAGSDQ